MDQIRRTIISIGTLGDSNVGKTNLASRYVGQQFNLEYTSTIGVTNYLKQIKIDIDGQSLDVKVKIWDTAGQERFRSLSINYIRNCLGLLMVYSVDNIESFKNIEMWLKEVSDKSPQNTKIPLVLIGNKCDLNEEVSEIDGRKLAEKYDMKFFLCSAKNNINVEEAFQCLIDEIVVVRKNEFVCDKTEEKKKTDDHIGKCCNKNKGGKKNEPKLNIKNN